MKLRAWVACLRCDIQRAVRDQFLVGALLLVVGIAVGLRFVIPWIGDELLARQGLSIAPYHAVIASYFALVNAQVLAGMVTGFLLVEAREEGVVEAQRVLPVPMGRVLFSSLILGAGASVVLALILGLFIGTGAPDLQTLLLSAVMASPMAMIFALLLGALADNKVQAFATAKIMSLLGIASPLAYLLPEHHQWLGGLVPLYWPCKIWWLSAEGLPWTQLIAPGLGVSLLWLGALFVYCLRVLRRA